MKKKTALILSLALVVAVSVGATIAWLTDKTDPVVNVFTAGDINIDLTETWNTDTNGDGKDDAWRGKMVPGNVLSKDPVVTVEAGSEASWVFVELVKSENFDTFLEYEVASGWTRLENKNTEGRLVYYRQVDATTADIDFDVLKDKQVTVKTTVTKENLNALTEANYPKLTVIAYAIQQANIGTVDNAWAEVSK